MKLNILILLSLFLISCTSSEFEGPYKVTKVTDGDTLQINYNQKIRLSEINSPEKDECHYNRSKNFLKDLLLNQKIFLEKDYTNKGRYGRLLRYIHFNNKDINAELVLTGNAKVYDKYAHDTKKYTQLKELETLAKKNKLGLWAC